MNLAASTVMAIAIGVVAAYVGYRLARFGVYALGKGEPFLGVAALGLGAVFLGAVLAVVVSQVRAWWRARR